MTEPMQKTKTQTEEQTGNGKNAAGSLIDAQTEHKPGTKEKISSPDILLYSDLYKNAMMGEESCAKMIGCADRAEDEQAKDGSERGIVSCEALRQEITDMLNGYASFAKKAKEALTERNAPAEQLTLLERMPAEVGITMQTIFDRSPSKLAELMINGVTMGIIDMKKAQRVCSEDGCSPDAYRTAADMIRFCEGHIEKLKEFL